MLQDGRREKNMNKKSVKFILPRQQIQEKRNIFDGSRTAALLESEQNSEKAHAKGCPAQRLRSPVLQNTLHGPRAVIQKGQGEKPSCQAQQMSCSLQGAAETVACAESPSHSVTQQHLNRECY